MLLSEQRKMTRYARPVKGHARGDNRAQQVFIVVIALAAVLGLGGVATDQYLAAVTKRQAGGTYRAAKGDDIYTGALLYMPETGNVCHQWLFDNQDGQFTDKGEVNCDDVADQGLDSPKNWSSSRIRVISDGFRH
ncbi:MAG: hypothetical protein WAM74_11900 [Xanthobacteraceae bacterium]